MKFALTALLSVTTLLAACSDGCENMVVTRTASPDGRQEAVLFERSCGATTGFSTQIAITRTGRSPSRAETAFVADLGQSAAQAAWGGPWAEAIWTSADHIVVRHDTQARVFKHEPEISGVRITYEPVEP